jgi:RHS repeat-associated protein
MNLPYVFNQTCPKRTGSPAGRGKAISQGLRKLAVMAVVLLCALTASAQYYYTDASGSFEDGSGSDYYASNTDKSYLIQPEGAGAIELTFSSFDTEGYYDFVYVYDGADESAPLIGRYDNWNLPPSSITSTGGSLYIRFTTNSENNYEGWSIYYTAQNPAFDGVYSDPSGTFDDSSGDASYPDNFTGTYLIQPAGASTVTLSFLYFNTEANHDFVYVYDGPDASFPLIGQYHYGSLPPSSITSTQGSLFIRFTSDGSLNFSGWRVDYSSVIKNQAFDRVYTEMSGTFDDSSGDDPYVNDFFGSYLIQPPGASKVTLSFPYFNTEANYDFVYVYDGPDASAPLIGRFHNGNLPPAYITSSGGSLFIRFDTDASIVMNGWTAQYTCNASQPTPTQTLSSANNYIYSITPQVEKSDLSQAAASDLNEEVVYFDGLGRPMQTIGIQASPNGQDIVTPITYDNFGRESTKYLPYATTTAGNGTFKTTAIDVDYTTNCDHYKFYNDPESNNVVNDTKPFSWTEFEPSPLNRVLRQGAPGATWQPGADPASDHSVKYSYQTNTASEVVLWKVSADALVNGGYYPPSSLYKTTTWDENNQLSSSTSRTEEFKDLQGRVVLKRSYNVKEVLSTYYVYDDFDLLRFVLTPKAMEKATVTQGTLDTLCYQYKYDGRKRMTGKRLPGADWVYMVYDKRDRLVASQDGVQRQAGRWLVTKYDQMNRPVITALKTMGDTPSALETYLKDYPDGSSYYESRDGSAIGYTTGSSFYPKLSLTESDILSVTYYDTYGFPGVKSFDTGVRVSDYYNSATGSYYFDKLKGQVTGTRVKVLDGTENNASGYRWLTSTSYYDDRYRPVQVLVDLYSPITTDNQVTSSLYDFTGKVMKTLTKQVFRSNTNTVLQTNTYDQAGRLTQVKHKVNNQAEVTLASMEYNELGQLKQKSLHGAVGSGIQNLNYAYNIRGWLEKINNPDVTPSSTSTQKLNLGLYYNSVPTGLPATVKAQYNGNIAAMTWNTPEQEENKVLFPADKQGYGFTYDGLNRLLTSTYGEGTGFGTQVGANNENLTYDKNGNILTLVRYKKGTGIIDNLVYTYKSNGSSNQLDRVDDSLTIVNGFTELVKQAGEYGYDLNGNLTSDLNKGFNSIQYNFLNLPKRVGTTSQYISYIYSADGTKLAKVGTDGVVTTYAGSFVYEGSSLKYIIHPEGMYLPGGNYQYYLKDHLGNTRLMVNTLGTGGTIVQQTDYYPFGMEIASYNGGVDNRYRYNGKELQTDEINGKKLDWYDYGARFYDPALGRWHSVDPKAELGRRWSSYTYCFNNPMRFIDPDGMWGDDHTGYIQSASNYQEQYQPITAFFRNLSAEVLNALGVGTIDDAIVTYNNPNSTTREKVYATIQAAAALVIVEGEGKTPVGEKVKPVGEKTYQTYIKKAKDPSTHGDYSGRTSGTGTPEQNIAKRDANHHMNDTHGPAMLDKSSNNPDAIRGREDQNIQSNGGAQSHKGTSGNRIEGISPNNNKKQQYINAANKEFGTGN